MFSQRGVQTIRLPIPLIVGYPHFVQRESGHFHIKNNLRVVAQLRIFFDAHLYGARCGEEAMSRLQQRLQTMFRLMGGGESDNVSGKSRR